MTRDGCLVVVVGRSGVGKDSVLGGARARLKDDPRFVFARRVITRPSDPDIEDHDTLPSDDFAAARAAGAFALHWSAHDLDYGVPVSIERDLTAGRIVVANTSRTIVAEAQTRYPGAQTIVVTARPETIAARLAARGREDGTAVAKRLARAVDTPVAGEGVHVVENDARLDDAVEAFTGILRRIAATAG